MTLTEQAERRTESLEYHSPVFYTLSGRCRVAQRGESYRAEILFSGAWAIMAHANGCDFETALKAACRE